MFRKYLIPLVAVEQGNNNILKKTTLKITVEKNNNTAR
jgi:hypothetical protein